MIELGELILRKGGSVDPLKFPNEKFQYFSIPAYDKNEAEIVIGKEIGSSKKIQSHQKKMKKLIKSKRHKKRLFCKNVKVSQQAYTKGQANKDGG
jgi:hypothetical protein